MSKAGPALTGSIAFTGLPDNFPLSLRERVAAQPTGEGHPLRGDPPSTAPLIRPPDAVSPREKGSRGWATFLLGAALLTAAPALAQAPQLPGPAQPGQLQERFEPPPAPQGSPTAPRIPLPSQTVPAGAEAARFRLTDLRLEGSTIYAADALRQTYASLIGTEVTLAQMIEVANALTARYRADGYILSQVVVPEQAVENGVVTFRAVEGYIDEVRIEGDVEGPRDRIEAFTDGIRAARPLTAEALERNVLLIGDLPGVNVQTILEPSATTFGAADLRVVLSHRKWEGFLSLDNRGSRFAGPWTLAAGASAFSLMGFYEQIDLLLATTPGTDEFQYGQGQFTLPVGPHASGDTLQVFAGFGRIRPDIPSSAFPFDTRAETFEARVTYAHPFVRSRSENFTGRVSAIWRDDETKIRDLPEDSRNPTRDEVRILQLRGTWDFTDSLVGVNLIDFSVNKGLGILGATQKNDRGSRLAQAEGDFTYFEATVSRLQGLGGGFALYGEVQAQYSLDPLFPSDRFGVGGGRIGRGFTPGNITGDRGVAAKIEPRYGAYVGKDWLDSYQLYAFVDAGRTWDTGDSPTNRTDIVSTGIGVRLNVTEKVSINPELTRQISGRPADTTDSKHETRLMLGLIGRF